MGCKSKVTCARTFERHTAEEAEGIAQLYTQAGSPVTITRKADDLYIVRVYAWRTT